MIKNFSTFLRNKHDTLKKIVELLSQHFEYVSILASDCQGQEITVSEKQISVKDSSYNERGFVIRVYKDGLYSEYSFDEILTVDEIVEKVIKSVDIKEPLEKSIYVKTVPNPLYVEEKIEQEFSRMDEYEDIDVDEVIKKCKNIIEESMEENEYIISGKCRIGFLKVSKTFISNKKDISQVCSWAEATYQCIVNRDEVTRFNYGGGSGALYYTEPQLELGSKTDYEPYGYKIPVKAKSNVFTRTNEAEGYFLSSYGELSPYVGWTTSDYIEVESNCNYSFEPNSTMGNSGKHCFYDKDKNFIGYMNSGPIEFTTPTNCKYMRFSYRNTSFDITLINENNTLTTNIYLNEPLRKIGDYADYIDFKNSKVVRQLKHLRLTSDLNWISASSGSFPYKYCNVSDIASGVPDKTFMCNNYQIIAKNTYNTDQRICYRLNYNGFFVTDSNYVYVDDFNEMLDNNNVYVIYPINQTEETIELPNIPTLKGNNILEVDTKTQPSNMEVIYKGKK